MRHIQVIDVDLVGYRTDNWPPEGDSSNVNILCRRAQMQLQVLTRFAMQRMNLHRLNQSPWSKERARVGLVTNCSVRK